MKKLILFLMFGVLPTIVLGSEIYPHSFNLSIYPNEIKQVYFNLTNHAEYNKSINLTLMSLNPSVECYFLENETKSNFSSGVYNATVDINFYSKTQESFFVRVNNNVSIGKYDYICLMDSLEYMLKVDPYTPNLAGNGGGYSSDSSSFMTKNIIKNETIEKIKYPDCRKDFDCKLNEQCIYTKNNFYKQCISIPIPKTNDFKNIKNKSLINEEVLQQTFKEPSTIKLNFFNKIILILKRLIFFWEEK